MRSSYYLSFKQVIKNFRCLLRRRRFPARIPFKSLTDSTIIVIAPHPDDETFGAGGMIALKRQMGVPVYVINLTEGEASHRSCCDISQEKVKCARHRHAELAAENLGLSSENLIWLDLEDGKIPDEKDEAFEKAVKDISNDLRRLKPKEIFCPHPNDGLPDHEKASRILQKALQRSGCDSQLIYYLVWGWYNSPFNMNKYFDRNKAWRLDIHSVYKTKMNAMDIYLHSEPAPCGIPYSGRLPATLLRCFRKPNEIFIHEFDHAK